MDPEQVNETKVPKNSAGGNVKHMRLHWETVTFKPEGEFSLATTVP